MSEACPNQCRHAGGLTSLPPFLAIILLGTFGSGCFVITSERLYKPDAPRGMVKSHSTSDGVCYSRMFYSPDLDLDVSVESGPDRWQVGLLFYILPVPSKRYDYLNPKP